MVSKQLEVFAALALQLLLWATPVKFLAKPARCRDASAIVGWGPVHLMPARRMLSLPPRRYRLHSDSAVSGPDFAAAAAASSWGLPNGCAAVAVSSQQEKTTRQRAVAQALVAESTTAGTTGDGHMVSL